MFHQILSLSTVLPIQNHLLKQFSYMCFDSTCLAQIINKLCYSFVLLNGFLRLWIYMLFEIGAYSGSDQLLKFA